MNKQSLGDIDVEAENRLKKREQRKRRRMKVSGARLKELQRIIIAK